MQSSPLPHRLTGHIVLGIVVAVLAAPLTYIELEHPTLRQVTNAFTTVASKVPHATTHVTVKSTTTPAKPKATSKPATVPAVPAQPVKTALTTSYVHLRSGKSVTSTIITDLNAGTTVQLTDDADTTWQGVTYKGKTGYIYRAYLQY